MNAAVAGGSLGGVSDVFLQGVRQRVQITEEANAHLLLLERLQFLLEHPLKQGHQETDLLAGS